MKRAEQLKAVGLGHVHVGDDEVIRLLAQGGDGGGHGLDRVDLVVFEPQELAERVEDDPVVIDEEDAAARGRRGGP